jgi:methionyl aminopeptidase
MRKAGKVVAEMHEATRAAIRPGITTLELNEVAAEVLAKRGARSNFLNYHGFPAVICTSPNDMIVHGIPGTYKLKEGDIISIDCGAITPPALDRSATSRSASLTSRSVRCGPALINS